MTLKKLSRTSHLTKTETIILNFISHGLTTKEIAETLNISTKTVETHRTNCSRKLKLDGEKNALLRFIIRNKYSG